MDRNEIKERIKGIVAGMFDLKSADIVEDKPFVKMAKYDSMRALEYLAKLENEFNVTIDPDLLQRMQTVDMSTTLIEELSHAG